MKKIILFLILSGFFYAEVSFYDGDLGFVKNKKEDSFCIDAKNNAKICYTYTEKTLGCSINCSDNLREIIKKVLAKVKKEAPKQTKEDLQDWADMDLNRNFYDNLELDVFSTTPNTITFIIKHEGYSGGAHGYYGVDFINVDKKSHKIIELQDIFKKNSKRRLLNIAEKYYKISKNIPENIPLNKSDSWEDDKFSLAAAFAVTQNGIYFFYNPYEVASYAFGTTDFLLPYEPIKDLIKPNSTVAFALKGVNSKVYYFKDEVLENNKKYSVNTELKVNKKGTKFELNFDINLKSPTKQVWISFSFPQFKDSKNIKIVRKSGFKRVSVYKAGSKIYNIDKKRAIKSKYLLIEGEPAKKAARLKISFLVDAKGLKDLIIDYRVVFKDKKTLINFPYYSHDAKGQQGFNNYRVVLPVE